MSKSAYADQPIMYLPVRRVEEGLFAILHRSVHVRPKTEILLTVTWEFFEST